MGLMMRNESRTLKVGGTRHTLLRTLFSSSGGDLEKSLSGFMKLGRQYGFTPTISAPAALIARQKVCPVMDGPLGGMGNPIKVMVGDKPIFLCCRGCIRKLCQWAWLMDQREGTEPPVAAGQ